MAVGAVAEESVDEAGGFGWLEFSMGFSRYGKMLGGCDKFEGQRVMTGGERQSEVLTETYECELYGAAEACSCRFVLLRPAILGAAGKRNVGFGFVCGCGHLLVCSQSEKRGIESLILEKVEETVTWILENLTG